MQSLWEGGKEFQGRFLQPLRIAQQTTEKLDDRVEAGHGFDRGRNSSRMTASHAYDLMQEEKADILTLDSFKKCPDPCLDEKRLLSGRQLVQERLLTCLGAQIVF